MLNEDEVRAVVREFLTNLGIHLGAFGDESELKALGIDSLQAVDLAFQFEERLGVTIPMEEFTATTVGDAIRFVMALDARSQE